MQTQQTLAVLSWQSSSKLIQLAPFPWAHAHSELFHCVHLTRSYIGAIRDPLCPKQEHEDRENWDEISFLAWEGPKTVSVNARLIRNSDRWELELRNRWLNGWHGRAFLLLYRGHKFLSCCQLLIDDLHFRNESGIRRRTPPLCCNLRARHAYSKYQLGALCKLPGAQQSGTSVTHTPKINTGRAQTRAKMKHIKDTSDTCVSATLQLRSRLRKSKTIRNHDICIEFAQAVAHSKVDEF